MTDKGFEKENTDQSVDVSRRRMIQGAAAGAVAGTGIITGFPYVHASEPNHLALYGDRCVAA